MLALKALLAGTGQPLSDGRPQHVEVRCDGRRVRELAIPADQADVVQQLDLSPLVARGNHRLTIVDRGDTAPAYQATFRYHLPQEGKVRETRHDLRGGAFHAPYEGLSIELAYDKTSLAVGDTWRHGHRSQ